MKYLLILVFTFSGFLLKAQSSISEYKKVLMYGDNANLVDELENDIPKSSKKNPDAIAIVIQGEMILGVKGSDPRKLVTGDTFNIASNTPHYEQYGSNGTTYWVARKGHTTAATRGV